MTFSVVCNSHYFIWITLLLNFAYLRFSTVLLTHIHDFIVIAYMLLSIVNLSEITEFLNWISNYCWFYLRTFAFNSCFIRSGSLYLLGLLIYKPKYPFINILLFPVSQPHVHSHRKFKFIFLWGITFHSWLKTFGRSGRVSIELSSLLT